MRSVAFTGASALILFTALVQAIHGAHEQLEAIHQRHRREREIARSTNDTLVKRGSCAFPADAGLIPVTPGSGNGGWAFAPDQSCTIGRYCPYACPPGQVSMQWDPSATSYSYPASRNGGLLCNSDGTVSKPFPDRPYCKPTSANIGVQNNCGRNVAFCQTVLPGDEDMLIPTDVDSFATLANPDTSYWAGTAAHYYINPPGVSSSQGCVWGTTSNPYGNWAPYVGGLNQDSNGQTFLKLGWNPIYLEPTTPFRHEMPTWGVRIECPSGGCNGLPCAIDPSKNKVNEMIGSASPGAGGGAFCVVTVPKGTKANFVVFDTGSDNDDDDRRGGHWSNHKHGGQFYQSSSQAASSTGTTSLSTSSSTTKSRSATPVPASNSSSLNGSSDDDDSKSNPDDGPDAKPHYQLFNSTSAEPSESVTSSVSSTTGPMVAKHTGGASSTDMSFALCLLALGTLLL